MGVNSREKPENENFSSFVKRNYSKSIMRLI